MLVRRTLSSRLEASPVRVEVIVFISAILPKSHGNTHGFNDLFSGRAEGVETESLKPERR
jgi:hypothetical protein